MRKIDSVAALKRIPVGTKLQLVATVFGPCRPTGRIVKQIRTKDIVMTIDDATNKNNGADSYLAFPAGTKVTPTDKGFAVDDGDGHAVIYEFVADAPSA